MFLSWEELGYSVDGFDLKGDGSYLIANDVSQSRHAWPSPPDIDHERGERKFAVALPDLNGKLRPSMSVLRECNANPIQHGATM